MEKILVVDDDPTIQRILCRTFTTNGLEVFVAGDAVSAMDLFHGARPDVVILDLMLPGKSGQELCLEMKCSAPYLPIIVLSAMIDEVDKVMMLELGADDYVTKPFSPREVVARVRAAVRRLRQRCNESEVLKFDDIEINFFAMEVRRAGENVPVSRSELLDKVWGYRCYPTTRTVDTHILRLRRKLEHDPSYPVHLHTVHGVGYRFVR